MKIWNTKFKEHKAQYFTMKNLDIELYTTIITRICI